MKKSEVNLAVLEGFMHWFTHKSEEEAKAEIIKDVHVVNATQLYEAIKAYIEEDHVDGKDNAEDHIVTFGAKSSFHARDKSRIFEEQVVVFADFGGKLGKKNVTTVMGNDVMGVNLLIKCIKDPYGFGKPSELR